MANYLVVYADAGKANKIERWFENNNRNQEDIVTIIKDEEKTCWYFARNAKNDRVNDDIFKGYAINHEQKYIVYSGNNEKCIPEIKQSLPGFYIRIQHKENNVFIGNDFFALFPMIYFKSEGVVAVSDSVFLLTELRRYLGIPNRIHTEAALARSWIHSMASQVLSPQTVIDGIFFCPPGTTLILSYIHNHVDINLDVVPAKQYFSCDITDYRETLHEAAKQVCSVISGLITIPESVVSLGLSGGLDSRTCLAAVQNQGIQDYISFNTNTNLEKDYALVDLMSKLFNFKLNDNRNKGLKYINRKRALQSWIISNAGIYNILLSPTSEISETSKIYINMYGGGGELYRGNFGWRKISQVCPEKLGCATGIDSEIIDRYMLNRKFLQKIPALRKYIDEKIEREVSSAAYNQTTQGLKFCGIDSECRMASEWYYLLYRNPIHFGRSSMNCLVHIPPIMQKNLVALSRSPLNQYPFPEKGKQSIGTDLLILLSPVLASLQFDESYKNLDPVYIQERATYLGQAEKSEGYSVRGNPRDVHSGTPDMILEMSNKQEWLVDMDVENIRKNALVGYEKLPPDLKKIYSLHAYIAEHEHNNMTGYGLWERITMGKLMSFLLAD